MRCKLCPKISDGITSELTRVGALIEAEAEGLGEAHGWFALVGVQEAGEARWLGGGSRRWAARED